jgi:phenylpropionate dioxygenase-like ring-hydroxylating dioxygenase large terminal subunit
MTGLPTFDATDFNLGKGAITPDSHIMASGHVSTLAYTSAERFVAEAELFGKVWLNIADEADIVRPGDWIVRDIPSSSASLLIWRDSRGVLRAFHNICSHRGMKIAWGKSGNSLRLSCPYHAWTFGADGGLKVVPDEACFPDLDKAASGLRPVQMGVWEGFVFINLDPNPPQTLAEYLAPVSKRFRNLPFKHFPQRVTIRQVINTNWKLALEAQSESYHIRVLHARTVSGMVSSSSNPFCHPLFWEALGPHRTWSTAINTAFTLADARPVQKYAFTHSAQLINATADQEAGAERAAGFNGPEVIDRGDPQSWGSDQLVLYPHAQINAGANGCWLNRFLPISADRTEWEAVYYYRAAQTHSEMFAQTYALAFNRDTLIEDNAATERQQAVLRSGAMPFVQFGRQEMMCRHNAAVTHSALLDAASPTLAAE